MRSLSCSAVLLSLLGTAAAQSFGSFAFDMYERAHPAGTGSVYTDSCTGFFGVTGYRDQAVVTEAGGLWINESVHFSGRRRDLGSSITGATAVTSRLRDWPLVNNFNRRRDELVVAHASGLSKLWIDNDVVQPPVMIGGSQFVNAVALCAADLQSDGVPEIIAIDQYRTAVHVLYASGSVTTYLAPEGRTVFGMATIKVSASDRRIVLATNEGLIQLGASISGNETTLVPPGQHDITTGSVATIRRDDGNESVAWVYRDESEKDMICWSPGNTSTDTAVLLGDLKVVGCAAGDFNGDKFDELILSQQSNHCATVLMNQQYPAVQFSTQPWAGVQVWLQAEKIDDGTGNHVLPQDLPAPANFARPTVADLDGDGDDDVVMMVQSQGEVVWIDSPAADTGSQIVFPTYGHMEHEPNNEGILDADVHIEQLGALPSYYSHAEIATWDLQWDTQTGQFSAVPGIHWHGQSEVPGGGTPFFLAFDGHNSYYAAGGGQLFMCRAFGVEIVGSEHRITRVGPPAIGYMVEAINVPSVASLPTATPSSEIEMEEPGWEPGMPEPETHKAGWVHLEPPPEGG